jgi:ATP-binding cassette subfamily C (CFTR/MRP) protein 1
VYTSLQLAVLIYWTVGPLPNLKPQIAAAVLVFVNGLLLLFVSHAEHTRSVKPSTLINVYLFLTLLFDCAIARTLWLLQSAGVIAKLFTSTAAVKFLVLTVEAWEKRSILLSHYQDLSPEVTSGILGRSVFWWLNPLMKTGFGRLLTDQDLYCGSSACFSFRSITDILAGIRFMIAWLREICSLKHRSLGDQVCRNPIPVFHFACLWNV